MTRKPLDPNDAGVARYLGRLTAPDESGYPEDRVAVGTREVPGLQNLTNWGRVKKRGFVSDELTEGRRARGERPAVRASDHAWR